MAYQVSGTSVIDDNKKLDNTTRILIPICAAANRPSSPVTGSLFLNKLTGLGTTHLEFYDGSSWQAITTNS